jgi:hypothetical protein
MQGFGQSQKNPFELLHRKTPDSLQLPYQTSTLKDTSNFLDTLTPAQDFNQSTNSDSSVVLMHQSNSDKIGAEKDSGSLTIEKLQSILGQQDSHLDSIEKEANANPFDIGEDSPPIKNDTISQTVSGNLLIRPESKISETEASPLGSGTSIYQNDTKISGAFMALIFLGIFLLLTIIVNINKGLFRKIYRASLNENFSALLYRERKHSALNYLYSIAYLIFFINVGMFLYLIQFLRGGDNQITYALWFLTLIPIVIYLVRHTVMYVLAFVFPIKKEINQFNFNIIVFNIMIGLLLIPINLFLAYGHPILHLPLLYVTLFILAGVYIFRQLRGVLNSSAIISTNVFLFFIYLCTVEILPLVVLLKFVV